jgi:hypothetical protein
LEEAAIYGRITSNLAVQQQDMKAKFVLDSSESGYELSGRIY